MFRKLKKKFWTYVDRSEFNHMYEPIDPAEYHSLFTRLARLYDLVDDDKKSLVAYVTPFIILICGLTNATVFLISSVHHIQVFQMYYLTDCATFLAIMCYQILISTSLMRGKKNYHKLQQAIRHDFQYICTRGQKYREKFFENQLLTFRGCVGLFISTILTGSSMTVSFFISLTVAIIKGTKRPVMFPFWLFDHDLEVSPAYECMLAYSLFIVGTYTFLYSFVMVTYVLWFREITCKADIINWNLEDLLADVQPAKTKEEDEFYTSLIKHRMSEIIEMHQSLLKLIEDYAEVFKKCLFYEQVTSSPAICMTAYCVSEQYKVGEIEWFLLTLCFGIMIVSFVPNFLCTHLLEKVESIGDACWDIPFWNAGKVVRPYLVLMMQRSKRPLPITAPGFANISLQTYSTILTRAYSCFNMLRQADFSG